MLVINRTFLELTVVVQYKGLFVCLNLGNSACEMRVAEGLCEVCCRGSCYGSFQKRNVDIVLQSSRMNRPSLGLYVQPGRIRSLLLLL